MLKHFGLNFGNCKIVSTFLLVFILMRNVFHDHLVRHRPRRHRKVPSSPKMLAPKQLVQRLELLQQLARRLTLDVLRHLRYRQTRRNRQKNMHMIFRYMTLDDLNPKRPAYLSDQLSNSIPYFTGQHRLPIFRAPHKMIFQIINCMRSLSVYLHLAILPEGIA